jgi:hypothetical protein
MLTFLVRGRNWWEFNLGFDQCHKFSRGGGRYLNRFYNYLWPRVKWEATRSKILGEINENFFLIKVWLKN